MPERVGKPRAVAVVGAGIGGLACARRLDERGVAVRVVDKSRGSGGRTATRRGNGVAFDHGAQYFTARDPRFVREVEDWERQGVAGEWQAEIVALRAGATTAVEPERRLVGVPGMSSIARHLVTGLDFEPTFHVAEVRKEAGGLALVARNGRVETGFDAVVLAVPAPQVVPLARGLAPTLAGSAGAARFDPCWATMVEFEAPLPVGFGGAFVDDSPLSWVARNTSKPGRPPRESWTLHGSPEWSRENFDAHDPRVIEASLAAFARAIGTSELPAPRSAAAHRWAFALPSPIADGFLFDASVSVGACGDWCAGPRVEGAFLSGLALADRLLRA